MIIDFIETLSLQSQWARRAGLRAAQAQPELILISWGSCLVCSVKAIKTLSLPFYWLKSFNKSEKLKSLQVILLYFFSAFFIYFDTVILIMGRWIWRQTCNLKMLKIFGTWEGYWTLHGIGFMFELGTQICSFYSKEQGNVSLSAWHSETALCFGHTLKGAIIISRLHIINSVCWSEISKLCFTRATRLS